MFQGAAKCACERYLTAKDMADDLWHFLGSALQGDRATGTFVPLEEGAVSTPAPSGGPTPGTDPSVIKIVPKGLRSFDAHDADFFLELLPARDRDGLPDSLSMRASST